MSDPDTLKNQLLTASEKVILNLTDGKYLDVSELQLQGGNIKIVATLQEGHHGIIQSTCDIIGLPIISNNLQGYTEALRLAGLNNTEMKPYLNIFIQQQLAIEAQERTEASELRNSGTPAYTNELKTADDVKATQRRYRLTSSARSKLKAGKPLSIEEQSALQESEARKLAKQSL